MSDGRTTTDELLKNALAAFVVIVSLMIGAIVVKAFLP
jgi:hypothetical protein